jgi:hypothetical protein
VNPASYVNSNGWTWECVEATARLGVSQPDAEDMTPEDQAALLEWCKERVVDDALDRYTRGEEPLDSAVSMSLLTTEQFLDRLVERGQEAILAHVKPGALAHGLEAAASASIRKARGDEGSEVPPT